MYSLHRKYIQWVVESHDPSLTCDWSTSYQGVHLRQTPLRPNQFRASDHLDIRVDPQTWNNTLLASQRMSQPFDLHRRVSRPSTQGRAISTTHMRLENTTTQLGRLNKTRSPVQMPYCGICWQVRAPSFSLSHSWNIYQHNLSPLDQLYTCHGLAINYLHAPDKHLSHWFLSLIWDGYTGRAFLSLCLLTFGQSPWGAKRSWQFRLKQQPPEKAQGPRGTNIIADSSYLQFCDR